jgi:hypothetical protein
MKVKTVTVRVKKMIQVAQFEPVEVEVASTAELEDDDDAQQATLELYKGTTKSLAKFMNNEVIKWTEERKTRTKKD